MSKSLGFNSNDKHIHQSQMKAELKNMASMIIRKPTFNCGQATHSNINLQCDITIPGTAPESEKEVTWKDLVWVFLSMSTFILSSIAFLVYSSMKYQAKNSLIAPSLISLAIFIAFITWFRNMLSMNMFHAEQRNMSRKFALVLYLLAGSCFFSSSLAVMQQDSTMQFMSSQFGLATWQLNLVNV